MLLWSLFGFLDQSLLNAHYRVLKDNGTFGEMYGGVLFFHPYVFGLAVILTLAYVLLNSLKPNK